MVERKKSKPDVVPPSEEIKESQSHGNLFQQEEVKGESGGTANPKPFGSLSSLAAANVQNKSFSSQKPKNKPSSNDLEAKDSKDKPNGGSPVRADNQPIKFSSGKNLQRDGHFEEDNFSGRDACSGGSGEFNVDQTHKKPKAGSASNQKYSDLEEVKVAQPQIGVKADNKSERQQKNSSNNENRPAAAAAAAADDADQDPNPALLLGGENGSGQIDENLQIQMALEASAKERQPPAQSEAASNMINTNQIGAEVEEEKKEEDVLEYDGVLEEGQAGPNDVDSLLNAGNEEGGPQAIDLGEFIEEDKSYLEEVEKGIEYDTDDSQGSDIPEEHENGFSYNEYMRRYMLNMKIMTWNRDSQGLFDYETRHCQKQKLTTFKSSKLVRVAQNCNISELDEDLTIEHGRKAQTLLNIRKVRNYYRIEPIEIERLKTMTEAEKKDFMSKDVDLQYAESGEQLQDPCDTCEKIYLIVRNIQDRNVKKPYTLKKHDIIKLGRVKFKVKKIYIKQVEEQREMNRQMRKRRESEWRRKEILRLKNQQKLNAGKKRFNSANLQAIQEALQKEEAEVNKAHQNQEEAKEAPELGNKKKDSDYDDLEEYKMKAKAKRYNINSARVHKNDESSSKPNNLDEIQEEREGSGGEEFELDSKKPKYFDEYDDVWIDSEDEMIAGENNYIQINCLPQPDAVVPVVPEENKEEQANAAVAAPDKEEEKKSVSDKRSSQYNDSQGGQAPPELGEEAEEKKESEVKAPEEEKIDPVNNTLNNQPPVIIDDDDDDVFCRFCWDGSNEIQNPLLSVCKCSGGVGFVHYTCLKYWLKTKMSEQRIFTSWTFYWRTFGCEICQQIYPYIFKANGRKYSLIDIKLPETDYLMLESLTLEKSTSRIIQILKPHMRVHTFRLGRGLDQDLRVNDISVSRYHAQIKFMYDKFILMDNLSKFGTLVMAKKGLDIYPGQSRCIQIGRTLINLHLSYLKPSEVHSSEIMYAPKPQIEKLFQKQDQSKVQSQVNQIYQTLKENEMYQKRQKMIHMQLNDNNFDVNHIYLQRRQLNIQDEEHVEYKSDDEEAKYIEPIPDQVVPEEAKSVELANQSQENGSGYQMPARGAGLLVPINNNRQSNEEEKKGIFDAPVVSKKLVPPKKPVGPNPFSEGAASGEARRKVPVRRAFLDINHNVQDPAVRPQSPRNQPLQIIQEELRNPSAQQPSSQSVAKKPNKIDTTKKSDPKQPKKDDKDDPNKKDKK